jgi:uncharacterized protein
MTRANRLLELQEIDLQCAAARDRLGRIAAALRDERALTATRLALTEAAATQAAVETSLHQRTIERDTARSHVEREEQQLYGGRVKGAKEVQNLQREVGALRRRLAELDDAALELMIQRDEAAGAVASARAAVAEAEASTARQRDVLSRKQAALTDDLRRLDGARDALARSLPQAELDLYEQLRQVKGGRAVSDLRDGGCGACGMLLPEHVVGRIHAGERTVRCPSCGRLVLV